MRTSNYNFDIDKHSLIKPVVIIRRGDHDIDTIKITLSNQGDPVDLTNAKVRFMGTTPAGNKIIDDVHIKIVDAKTGIFEYTFPSAAGSSVGEYQDAYFSIILGNGQTSTMNFRIQVLSGVDISAPAASDYVSQYNTTVSNLNSAYDSAAHDTNDKMASTVSSIATSAATVMDSALARVNDIDSTVNNTSSAASNAVSMAASVASTVTSQASYINSVASSAASNVSSVTAGVVDKLNNIKEEADNAYVKKSGDTMTGALTVGGNPVTGSTGTLIGREGSIELGADTAFINFHGGNSTSDFTSRIYDSGDGLGNKIVDKSGFKVISTPLLASSTNKYNLDTVAFGSMILTGYSHKVIVSNQTDLLGKSPYTENGDGITNILGNAVITWERGYNERFGTQTITNLSDSMSFQRSMRNGVWQPWVTFSNDADVVHKTGNETAAGDKTFTGNTTFSSVKSSNIKTASTKLGDMTINFRETAVGVNVFMDGTWRGEFSMGDAYVDGGSIPTSITNPRQNVVLTIVGNSGVGGVSINSPFKFEVLIDTDGKIKYRSKSLRENDRAPYTITILGADSNFYLLD